MKKKLIGLFSLWLTLAMLTVSVGAAMPTFTISFNADGGSGRMTDQIVVEGEETPLKPNEFTRTGYEFVGWETCTGSGDLQFDDGDTVTVYMDMELFAIWEESGTSAGSIHRCVNKCEVCGGCTDLKCKRSICREKCRLLVMDFEDVSEDAWYSESVEYVYHRAIMEGIEKNLFGVDHSTTRAMIVTMIWRLEGHPVVNVPIKFVDVPAELWYSEAVRWAASEGIVIGVTEELFKPEDNITREQMAAIIFRYAQYKKVAPEGAWAIKVDYPDLNTVAEYALEPLMYCTLKKLMVGRDGGAFEPRSDATRAEIAVIFHRFLDNE